MWWDNVCEDALTIKGGSASSVTSVIGGDGIVTVNKNLNDQATIENIKIKGKKVNVCAWTESRNRASQRYWEPVFQENSVSTL
ncbi:hypothetical protein PsorP6_005791 [Peronosclerospora sorghi]|uniref:Uncharacterized protein n=1 Tax=Peronosclerospora sorghi TaxID=230839 RepID=A0ACC0W537_9STRA|nr:hypothetical protein PsorP6_005791 [Peronosclerospora sorghi]